MGEVELSTVLSKYQPIFVPSLLFSKPYLPYCRNYQLSPTIHPKSKQLDDRDHLKETNSINKEIIATYPDYKTPFLSFKMKQKNRPHASKFKKGV